MRQLLQASTTPVSDESAYDNFLDYGFQAAFQAEY